MVLDLHVARLTQLRTTSVFGKELAADHACMTPYARQSQFGYAGRLMSRMVWWSDRKTIVDNPIEN